MNFLKLCFLLFLLNSKAFAYYDLGAPQGFVSDYANLLTAEQKQALESKITSFKESSKNEIAVVIIPDLKGDEIENFAVELFEKWGIGKKDVDNGVLLLVSMKEHKLRI